MQTTFKMDRLQMNVKFSNSYRLTRIHNLYESFPIPNLIPSWFVLSVVCINDQYPHKIQQIFPPDHPFFSLSFHSNHVNISTTSSHMPKSVQLLKAQIDNSAQTTTTKIKFKFTSDISSY